MKKINQSKNNAPKEPWVRRTSSMLMVIGLLAMTLLTWLVIYIANDAGRTSQDLRQQASVPDGEVNVTAQLPEFAGVGQEQTISLRINTHQVQLDGLLLSFDIVTDTTDQVIIEPTNRNLNFESTEVDRVAHGFSAAIRALSTAPDRPFSSNRAVEVAQIKFTPTRPGEFSINFDTELSVAPVHNTDPVRDELTHVAPITLQISKDYPGTGKDNLFAYTNNLADQFEFLEVDSDKVVDRDDLETGSMYVVKHHIRLSNYWYDSRSSDPTPVITELQAAESGLARSNMSYSKLLQNQDVLELQLETSFVAKEGANNFTVIIDKEDSIDETDENDNQYTFAVNLEGPDNEDDESKEVSDTCNDSCVSNNDCSINQRCYDTGSDGKRCRLATNVSSTSCTNAADQGLNRQCNEYCADTNECASGFTCWNNRCRNPYNVESTTCPALTTTQTSQIAEGCNKSCTTSSDCATNLICSSGSCRLVSNPSSSSCSAAVGGVSASPTAPVATVTSTTPKPTARPTIKPITTPAVEPKEATAPASPRPTPIPTREPTPEPDEQVEENEIGMTMTDGVLGSVMGVANSLYEQVTEFISQLRSSEGHGSEEANLDPNSFQKPQRDFMSYLPMIIIGAGAILLIIVILKSIGSLLSRKSDDEDEQDPPGQSGPTPIPWQPAQKPPQTHGHGMTPPSQSSVTSGGVSGGMTNPSQIEEIETPDQDEKPIRPEPPAQ